VGGNYRDIRKLWGKITGKQEHCGGELAGYREIVGGNYRKTGKLWGKINGIAGNCGEK